MTRRVCGRPFSKEPSAEAVFAAQEVARRWNWRRVHFACSAVAADARLSVLIAGMTDRLFGATTSVALAGEVVQRASVAARVGAVSACRIAHVSHVCQEDLDDIAYVLGDAVDVAKDSGEL